MKKRKSNTFKNAMQRTVEKDKTRMVSRPTVKIQNFIFLIDQT